ncbi:MAG: hypothetical protein QOI12_150 [Alphaproteobacteria bacterium]|jgi:hypothetical protein|nr:hypothetical protein [Alphaproteobacteria bacterium]
MMQVFGKNFSMGEGYDRNFAQGRFGRARAARIYEWIRANYPDDAQYVEDEITNLRGSAPSEWDRFIAEHGRTGLAWILKHETAAQNPDQQEQRWIPDDGKRDQVQRQPQVQQWRPSPYLQRMPILTPFFFFLEIQADRYVVGLQAAERKAWAIMPLGSGTRGALCGERSRRLPASQVTVNETNHPPALLKISRACSGLSFFSFRH